MFFFDLDGTLIDSNGVWKHVDREFLARRGIPYTHAYYEGVAHTILPLAAEFTKEFCHLEESCEDIIAEWMDLAKDAYAHVTVKPGVRAYLKQCRAEGRRMAVVTSSVPVHCRTAMEKLDLMKYFESVTFAQELGIEKKNKDLWLHAAERYGKFLCRCADLGREKADQRLCQEDADDRDGSRNGQDQVEIAVGKGKGIVASVLCQNLIEDRNERCRNDTAEREVEQRDRQAARRLVGDGGFGRAEMRRGQNVMPKTLASSVTATIIAAVPNSRFSLFCTRSLPLVYTIDKSV